ncbi:DUF397 domain-containing protein [Sphaerimonospora thailandensis]|uniref:DUF397 domain-containing protein n=1 Tax=Sphaerimonospora thailandensis TaxID=795644 RepID=A0A8J3REC2_9ACTN|nr:DUF397 domain-containing protein [Sphaerimonospora thailandensis]GIH73448.1 hypothetical protein Mth01_57010 [Sphaerimonospora thailandensis]
MSGKPTVEELGIDLDEVGWVRAGDQADALEVAILPEWVLVRETGPSSGPIHVFDHGEWSAFIQGVKAGEFDDVGSFPPAG